MSGSPPHERGIASSSSLSGITPGITPAWAGNRKDDQTKIPKNQWFADQIKNGLLVYMNTKKSSEWTNQTGLRLPAANTRNGRSIPNEVDLVKLRNQPEYETYYQTSQSDSDNVA
ncbi:MAG: hypothetical protein IJP41_01815, partial [Synergistaceae bacterium]|nr:hypothetical protein [Synergistaceae bacterium]